MTTHWLPVCRQVTYKPTPRTKPQPGARASSEPRKWLGTIAGIACTYGKLGQPNAKQRRLRFHKGCFAKALRMIEMDPLFAPYLTANHDTHDHEDRVSNVERLRLYDSPEGLRFSIGIPNTPSGRSIMARMRRHEFKGVSVCVRCSDVDDVGDIRDVHGVATITELSLTDSPSISGTDCYIIEDLLK